MSFFFISFKLFQTLYHLNISPLILCVSIGLLRVFAMSPGVVGISGVKSEMYLCMNKEGNACGMVREAIYYSIILSDITIIYYNIEYLRKLQYFKLSEIILILFCIFLCIISIKISLKQLDVCKKYFNIHYISLL